METPMPTGTTPHSSGPFLPCPHAVTDPGTAAVCSHSLSAHVQCRQPGRLEPRQLSLETVLSCRVCLCIFQVDIKLLLALRATFTISSIT